ncbi:hypothetical protein RV10_GL001644 [Enterococcus pallens]|nr:hypothetical protein RV10_GL001644 [Enterococcus pallens]
MEQAEEGYSIDEQIDKLKKYCEIKEWTIAKVYKDGGFSGSNIERPALLNMIDDAKQRKFDTVIVYRLDRLSRSQKDTLYLIEDVFSKYGVTFVSLSENFDTNTAFGKAIVGILAVFAQLEREQIRERLMMGKVGRAKSGKAMAWSNFPYGYTLPKGGKREKYEIVEIQAEIVRRIYRDYLNGKGITQIKDELNAEGHIGKEKPWTIHVVRRILDYPVYAGYNRYRGEVYEGQHEAIISKDIFERTQKEMEKRQKKAYSLFNNPRPFQAKYLLSGLLKCGICGMRFELIQYKPRPDGSRIRYYKCYSQSSSKHCTTMKKNPDGCTAPKYYLPEIEEYILNEVEKLRLNPDIATSFVDDSSDIDVSSLENRINELNSQLKKLVSLYVDEDFPRDIIESKKEKIISEKNAITKKIREESDKKPDKNVNEIIDELGKIRLSVFDLDYEEQKKLVRKLIQRITLFPDRIDIHWTFTL